MSLLMRYDKVTLEDFYSEFILYERHLVAKKSQTSVHHSLHANAAHFGSFSSKNGGYFSLSSGHNYDPFGGVGWNVHDFLPSTSSLVKLVV